MCDTGDEPFLIVGILHGRRLEVTAGSPVASALVAEYLRGRGAIAVNWQLRDDIPQPRPVLLLTRAGGEVHATPLVPGKPAAEHPETLCGVTLDWPVGVSVCFEVEMGRRCPGCGDRFAELMRQ